MHICRVRTAKADEEDDEDPEQDFGQRGVGQISSEAAFPARGLGGPGEEGEEEEA